VLGKRKFPKLTSETLVSFVNEASGQSMLMRGWPWACKLSFHASLFARFLQEGMLMIKGNKSILSRSSHQLVNKGTFFNAKFVKIK
jgi:hypothetical protein